MPARDGRTDGRTDAPIIANTRLCLASRLVLTSCKNVKTGKGTAKKKVKGEKVEKGEINKAEKRKLKV